MPVRDLWLLLLLSVGGCTPIKHAFECRDSSQCINDTLQGTCEGNKFCSFPDASCGSGRRYGGFAGNGLGGACVTASDTCGAIGEACCPDATCQAGLMCTAGSCVGCVTQLALGDGHGCALKRDGTMACWGRNDHGQLGNGTTNAAAAAVPVVDDHGMPVAGVTAITAGAAHTCALKGDRTVVCWGDDSAGQLGRGGSAAVNVTPLPVGLNSVVAMAAGGRHTCAALTNGAVWCWGANDAGQLGSAPSAGASMPVEVVDRAGLPLDAAGVVGGATHACAIAKSNALWCWGSDVNGELGDGASAATSQPVQAASLGTHVVAAAAGPHVTCALMDSQRVLCFGLNDMGQAGQAPGMAVPVPMAVSLDLATAVAAGGTHACARRQGGQLLCWGDGKAVTPVRDTVGAIAAGATDTCSARPAGVDCGAFGDPHLVCN
jgi:Regulator of chromosome condensation (RCC1) repeat